MTRLQRASKRSFDVVFSLLVLVTLGWAILLAIIAASVEMRQWGLFSQARIGRHARPFRLYKVRTMRSAAGPSTSVTKDDDPRITFLGSVLRKTKVDELPQFANVLLGRMSVVGPRPDVPGFADMLDGDDRVMLTLRPGITGPASVAFRDEERWLSSVDDADSFDVLVTENMFGDILSDLMAGLVGGLGMAPGGNIGRDVALFEPVHGSAPDLASRGVANPTAMLLAGCMMLEHIGQDDAATRVRRALDQTFAEARELTIDLGGQATTDAFADAVIRAIED